MKKSVSAIVLSAVMIIAMAVPAFAASSINSVKTDYPAITAEVKASAGTGDSLDASKIKATLDGQELTTGDLSVSSTSTDWIIMVDTTLSLDQASFTAEKNAIKTLCQSLGDKDSLILYTFEAKTTKILDGTETKDEAVKKINAITANGQDTAFYDAVKVLTDAAAESKADSCVALIYTDGVETLNSDKDAAVKALEESGVPIYGLCPDSTSSANADALNSLLKKSGGKATSFADSKASDTLQSYKKISSETITLNFTADGDIAANDKAVLSIDLGDGSEPITYETPVEAYEANPTEATTEEETEATETTAEGTPETETESSGFNPMIIVAAVVVILLVVLLVILSKKKGGKKEKKAEKPAEAAAAVTTEEPAEEAPVEEAPAEPEEEPEEEVPAEEPAAEEPAPEEASAEETPAEEQAEEPEEEHEETEEERLAREEAERKAEEERAAKNAALEAARSRASARAATIAQAAKDARASAAAKAAAEAEEKERLQAEEKAKAQAAKERAKQDRKNKKKMKEEGANFQFYFVDKDDKK